MREALEALIEQAVHVGIGQSIPGMDVSGSLQHLVTTAEALRSALSAPQPAQTEPVTLTYTNYRGETAQRAIIPKGVWFGWTDWHPEPQWLLTAFDVEKQADRDFALKDFGSTTQPAPSVREG